MSVFEDKIKQNQDYFDQKEPEIGHLDRFINKLNQADPGTNHRFQLGLFYKIAAGVTILIALGLLSIYVFNINQRSGEVLVNSIEYSQDLNDVFAYYDAISTEKVNEIDQYIDDPEKANEVKQAAIQRMEDIDGSLASIEKELSKNPNDENIKATLINIKRKKVKVMDDILLQLDFANTSLF